MKGTVREDMRTSGSGITGGRELRIQCPRCYGFVGELLPDLDSAQDPLLLCSVCLLHIAREQGIWRALPPTRRVHFERFLSEYQAVRAPEGRGSDDPAYYLALPYRDLTGRNRSQWAIRAQTFRYITRIILPPLESRYPDGMNILDLGAGNGWLSYRLALQGHHPVAVDLITNNRDGLSAATHFKRKLPVLFPRFESELDRLPFSDHQFDLAIFHTFFHYSEDHEHTLSEAIRCLRPGGTVIIADTVWCQRPESGRQMVAERSSAFVKHYGFPSDSTLRQEFLTDEQLLFLARRFHLHWQVHSPYYGIRWTMRPLLARLRGRREPSRFRIYLAETAK